MFEFSNDVSIILSDFSQRTESTFIGWEDLDCKSRWKLWHHIFTSHLSSGNEFTMGHVTKFIPCKHCPSCVEPNCCSYSRLGICHTPHLPTQDCSVAGCNSQMHHICQIAYQKEHNCDEHAFTCARHHSELNLLCTSSPSTRRQNQQQHHTSSSTDRLNSFGTSHPIVRSLSTRRQNQQQHHTSTITNRSRRRTRGRGRPSTSSKKKSMADAFPSYAANAFCKLFFFNLSMLRIQHIKSHLEIHTC